jgi:hypothetical protein
MLKRSVLWRQAQVCLSRARVTGDPILKELYEDMAVDFAHNAAREQDLDSVKASDWENGGNRPHK